MQFCHKIITNSTKLPRIGIWVGKFHWFFTKCSLQELLCTLFNDVNISLSLIYIVVTHSKSLICFSTAPLSNISDPKLNIQFLNSQLLKRFVKWMFAWYLLPLLSLWFVVLFWTVKLHLNFLRPSKAISRRARLQFLPWGGNWAFEQLPP